MPITVTHSTTVPGFPQVWLYGDAPVPVYYISGTVTDATGTPVERTVRLYDYVTGELIDEMLSDSVTGEYKFNDIGESIFHVIALSGAEHLPDLIQTVVSGTDEGI